MYLFNPLFISVKILFLCIIINFKDLSIFTPSTSVQIVFHVIAILTVSLTVYGCMILISIKRFKNFHILGFFKI